MLTALDYILDGLVAELELERELGVRRVECALQAEAPRPTPEAPAPSVAPSPPVAKPPVAPAPSASAATKPAEESGTAVDLVFLHDRPLSEAGVSMMAKIIVALGYTAETAPIVLNAPVPKAKVYVVLGGLALRKFLPRMRGAPGQWLKTPKGADVLVTYSPEYILRFGEVTPSVKALKQQMWTALKSVLQRLSR